mmetsp:Transcript_10645/g.5435  ORF Transcript_10645/g.5435 Transcript_10645/m.5435 type:complete len:87 (+) Transcript_10645:377-637(+)
MKYKIMIIPIFDLIDKVSLESIIDQTGVASLAVSNERLTKILELKSQEKIPSLQNLILLDEPTEDLDYHGMTVYSFHDLLLPASTH